MFVRPNNSGKTTALQALALWELGLRTWMEKRGKHSTAKQRVGVVVNKSDYGLLARLLEPGEVDPELVRVL